VPNGGFARAVRPVRPLSILRYGQHVMALQLRQPAMAATAPLQLVERADPEPAADELVLEVTACAVCRTDLQLAEGDLPARRLPIVPGHQAVGRVVKLAASIPIRTAIQTFSLADGNEALRRLASGDLEATAVLVTGDGDPANP
jgi:D-arabinose 1-dehydrogenase-like Zn-dependent alcohol dehydrogenase